MKTNGRRSKWVATSEREEKNEYWENDTIQFLPRVGKTSSYTHTLLLEAGINTIGGLARPTPIRGIRVLHAAVNRAQPGSCPNSAGIDHRNVSNPYESKLGES